jgi:hypothetical protein
MTDQTAGNAADSGALSLDQFVGVLDKEAEAPAAEIEEEETPETEVAAETETAEVEEPDLEDEEIEADVEEEEELPETKLPPPQSWAKEDHAAWAELPAKVQEVVAKREADRDRAVSVLTQQHAETSKQVKALAENYDAAAKHLTDDAERAETAWVKRWGNVDWTALADKKPNDYIYYKAQADQERDEVLHLRAQRDKARADAEHASKLERNAFLKEEGEKLAKIMPELMDPKEGPARRQALAVYAFESYPSITPEVLANASADELSILEKARRYDESQKRAKAQATLPRKNPTSTAKPTPTGGGQAVASPQRNLQAASQKLTKTGRLDDFVNLLNVEEEQRNRKARAK